MIKKLINSGNYPNNINVALLVLRLGAGGFMLTHGAGKFSKLLGSEPIAFADPFGVGAEITLALAVFTEIFCAILLMIGLATRFAAIGLLITMLVAAFIVHATDGFGVQEMSLLYAVMYLVLSISGAGKYSADSVLYK